ncbi:MAG: sulfite exporter TauE/SafE family protein [Planctomycetota bacterium]
MTYFYIGLIVACGAMIQGAIGFAFGIFSIPLLVWVGFPLEQAITLVLGLVVVQTLSSIWQNRAEVPWRELIAISIPRYLAVVLGVYLLHYVRQNWEAGQIRQLIGACLLVIISVQLGLRPNPRESLAWWWAWITGSLSGVMAGLIGMGGPAVVLWVIAHDWDSQKSRTLLWCAFSIMVPWQILVAWQRFGWPVVESAGLGLAYSPIVFVATLVGTRIGNRISQATLRYVAYGILIMIGLSSLLGPWIRG